ncbi:MAG: flippase-like domain-containing protein [Bacteroidetes bacterium]|nr:flippase-like domain-containing protein [Bacteroidota bacterium]
MQLNKNIKLILNYFLGPILFLFLLHAIYHQLLQKSNWRESLYQIGLAVTGKDQWKIWIVFLLMLVNWGIEAAKWKISMAPVQQIRFWRAYRATLTGTTMASFTPNRTGEYLGRILYVEEGKRLQSISLTIVCSLSQLIITMIMGCAGIFYLQWYLDSHPVVGNIPMQLVLNVLLAIVIIAIVVLAILYFRLVWLVKLIYWFRLPEKYLAYVKFLEALDAKVLLRILSLSFLRYAVFIAQYYFMFSVFAVSISRLEAFGSVAVIFLIMAIVPTFTVLTELGLRWEAAIQVVQIFSINTVGIFAASFGIWLINLVIPALAGSLLILGIKLFKK